MVECLTGKLPAGRRPRAPRPGGCRPARTAAPDAEGSGLDGLESVAASPDGRSLYAVSPAEDSVAVFRTRPLRLRECFTADVKLHRGRRPCRRLPHAGRPDDASGFNEVWFVAVSPDGRSVYTIAEGDAVGIFARARNGALRYRGCISGRAAGRGAPRHPACEPIATATHEPGGEGSGLGGATSLAISPDGRFVYVAAKGDAAVAIFARHRDGSLAFRGCLTGYVRPPLSSPCALVAGSGGNPDGSGLRGVERIAISPDGRSLYASSPYSSALAEFRRGKAGGRLTYRGCLTGRAIQGAVDDPCVPIPSTADPSASSGMEGIDQLAISPDGRSVYGTSAGNDAIDSFHRDPASGDLTYAGCITGRRPRAGELGDPLSCETVPGAVLAGSERVSGLGEPVALALSPRGRDLYVATGHDAAIARLARDPRGGALSFAGCLSGGGPPPSRFDFAEARRTAGPCATARPGGARQQGFAGLGALAIAGGDLYASATDQSTLARFAIGPG